MHVNGLTTGELFKLIFSPPCRSKVSHRIFKPPDPSYSLITYSKGQIGLHLTEKAEWQGTDDVIDRIEVLRASTWTGSRIICMFFPCDSNPRYTILYSHGHCVDLGMLCNFFEQLSEKLHCNVFSYDYSGYGSSSGKPSESSLYSDIDAAWELLKYRFKVRTANTILFGKFLGTVPTIYLAAKHAGFAGVILQAPLMSGIKLIYPNMKRMWFCDSFVNYERILMIHAPTLVMHGDDDPIVHFNNGKDIRLRCPGASPKPFFLHNVGHNMEQNRKFIPRLEKFIMKDIPDAKKA